MKWRMASVLAFWLASGALGTHAAAPSLESLEKQVRGLRAENSLLQKTVKRQKKQIAALRKEIGALKAAKRPSGQKRDSKTTAPLTGRDLVAWKLARDAARKRLPAFYSGGQDICYPIRVFEAGQPTKANMTKTHVGDYLFRFTWNVAVHPKDRRIEMPLLVYVTDFGEKLQVDRVEWTEHK